MSYHGKIKVVVNGRSDILKITINGGTYYEVVTTDVYAHEFLRNSLSNNQLLTAPTTHLISLTHTSDKAGARLNTDMTATLRHHYLLDSHGGAILEQQEALLFNSLVQNHFTGIADIHLDIAVELSKILKIKQKLIIKLDAAILCPMNMALLIMDYSNAPMFSAELRSLYIDLAQDWVANGILNFGQVVPINYWLKFDYLYKAFLERYIAVQLQVNMDIQFTGLKRLESYMIHILESRIRIVTITAPTLIAQQYVLLMTGITLWMNTIFSLEKYISSPLISDFLSKVEYPKAIMEVFQRAILVGIIKAITLIYNATLEKFYGTPILLEPYNITTGSDNNMVAKQFHILSAGEFTHYKYQIPLRVLMINDLHIGDTDSNIIIHQTLHVTKLTVLPSKIQMIKSILNNTLSVYHVIAFSNIDLRWLYVYNAPLILAEHILFENQYLRIYFYLHSLLDTYNIVFLDTALYHVARLNYGVYLRTVQEQILSTATIQSYLIAKIALIESILPTALMGKGNVQKFLALVTADKIPIHVLSTRIGFMFEQFGIIEKIWPVRMMGGIKFISASLGILSFDNTQTLPMVIIKYWYNIIGALRPILSTKLRFILLIKCRALGTPDNVISIPLTFFTNVLTYLMSGLHYSTATSIKFFGIENSGVGGIIHVDEWLYPIYIDVLRTQLWIRQIHSGVQKGKKLIIS